MAKGLTQWKREFYARQYAEGTLALARAAQEAGVSLWEMIDYVRESKIASRSDLPNLQHDLRTVLHDTETVR